MTDTSSTMKCKNCRQVFHPDLHTKGAWLCPNCQTRNPNLRRHYRSIAGLCILGFVAAVIVLVQEFTQEASTVTLVLGTSLSILLLVMTIFVCKAETPWTDAGIRALIWTVYGLAVLFTVVVPLVLTGILNMSPIILYALAFPYLFWVDGHARRSGTPSQQKRKQGNNHDET